jgi:hypothetical protein
MQQPTGTTTSQQIRDKYGRGRGRGGKSYNQIAREFGCSRSLVHTVLTRPLLPRSQLVLRRRTAGMGTLVVRLHGSEVSRLRLEANSRGKTSSALVRDILIAYCQQLQKNTH